jgi:glycosyltransferase involved in cell wall biosynthesis
VKNILMILQSDFPPDFRVEKEALSLIKAGYKVTILCDNRIPKQRFSIEKGINIVRMRHYYSFSGRLNKFFNIPIYPNPLWLYAIKTLVIKEKIDILHVHDLPLAYSTIRIGKSLGIPVIFDLHENYPAALELWRKPGIIGSTIRNPRLAQLIEGRCLNSAQKIIVVDQEHKNLLISRGQPQKKIFIIANTPYKALLQMNHEKRDQRHRSNSKYNLLYFGKISPERDIEVAFDAIPLLKEQYSNFKMIIIGDGPHTSVVKKRIIELGIQEEVELKGWLNISDTIQYFNQSDICILPQGSNALIDNGIPNKLFEYMALGNAIVAADSKAISRIIIETQCGEIFQSGSTQDFIQAIKKIYKSNRPYRMNGRKAILEKYNWEQTEINLLELYSEL